MSEAPTTIYVQWSDDGQHIRKWSHEPFDGGTAFVPADTITALRAEVERLREALEFYADKEAWNQPPVKTVSHELLGPAYENAASRVRLDRGKIARAALTQTKDTTDDA